MEEKKKVKVETIVRLIVLVITLINQVLIIIGKNPLPFSEDAIYTGLSAVASIVVTLWAWWKNNSFTQAALKADEYMKDLKNTADLAKLEEDE